MAQNGGGRNYEVVLWGMRSSPAAANALFSRNGRGRMTLFFLSLGRRSRHHTSEGRRGAGVDLQDRSRAWIPFVVQVKNTR